MSEIVVSEISKIFTYEYVLENVSFEVSKGERVALIGRNGAGKTTLFNIITGKERKSGDIGNVILRKGTKVGCLDQIPTFNDNVTPTEILYKPFNYLKQMQLELNELENLMSKNDSKLQDYMKKFSDLQLKFEVKGGYEIENNIRRVCVGLKISKELLTKSFNTLSGGEQTRVILGSILLAEPDILLLDEPTNHLDLESVIWLEDFLKRFTGAALIITHDRYFIDKVINKIIYLRNKNVEKFNSNYTNFAIEMKNRFANKNNEYEKLKKEMRRLRLDLRKSVARNNKNHSQFMSIKIRGIAAEIEEKKKISKPKEDKVMMLDVQATKKSSKIVLRMENVCHSFGEKKVLKHLNFFVKNKDKVAIVGPNGGGKSTLIKLMMNQINSGSGLIADSGEVYVGAGIKVGYLDQNLDFPDENISVLEEICRALNIKQGPARTILAKFLFYTLDIEKQIKILSGGEKTRLKLAILVHREINTLVLDEPTNHMDIQSRELLEEVLNDFDGSVIIISHDRFFINKVAKSIAHLNEGKIEIFEGNYDFFQNKLRERKDKIKIKNVESIQKFEVSKKQSNQEKKRIRRINEIEKIVYDLEEELKKLDEDILTSGSDYILLQKLIESKEEVDAKLLELMEEWEGLQ